MSVPSPAREERIGIQAAARQVGQRVWAVVFVLAFLTLPLLGPTSAEATTAIVTGTEWVFVRRGPGNQFPPFARIPSGSTVEVQEVEGDWARIITASGQVGFIHKKFLAFPAGGEPATAHPPPATHREPSAQMATPTRTPPTKSPTARAPTAVATPTEARYPTPTRTLRPTRTPKPTRTPTLTRSPSPTRTPTPTFTWSPTRTVPAGRPPGASATATASPVAQASPAVTAASPEGSTIPAWEAELLALKQELVMCRQQNNATPSLASCPDEVKRELARLREILEATPRVHTVPLAPNPDPAEAAADDRHAVSPIAVFLGTAGLILGWWGGSRYARRQERARRSRLRF